MVIFHPPSAPVTRLAKPWKSGSSGAAAKLNSEDTLFRDLGADAPTSVAALVADHRYRWDVVLMDG